VANTTHQYKDFTREITRGNPIQWEFAVTRQVDGVTSAQDLTGRVVRIAVGRVPLRCATDGQVDPGDPDTLFILASDGTAPEISITDAVNGAGQVGGLPSRTASLPENYYKPYMVRCDWIDTDGTPHTFQTGQLVVWP
jgi:hypothetical protein